MSGWPVVPFGDALEDASGGNRKIPQSMYLPQGRLPVVDQGKSVIAGFTDDESFAVRGHLPVILFGDHTRAFKFVDFPFALGADGVKVLRSRAGWFPRYLYHYLKQATIPVAGYSRHFKFLKELRVPKPPLDEQQRIAGILDRADALHAQQRQLIATLDDLAASIYREAFESERWVSWAPLSDLAVVTSGITVGRRTIGDTREVPYMAVSNVQDRHLNLTAVKTIYATDAEIGKYRLVKNDLLLTEGGDPDKLGRGSLWHNELPDCIHQNHIFRVRITRPELVNAIYLNWHVGSRRGKSYFLRSAKQTTGIASINLTQLKAFPIQLPPLGDQERFAERAAAISRLAEAATTDLHKFDGLIRTLQHRAFRGKL